VLNTVTRTALLLFALASAFPSSAQILFSPVAPDSGSSITARVFGAWCGIRDPEVTVSGNKIDIMVLSAGGVCIATYPTPVAYAQLGQLPGGVYDVTVRGVAAQASATLVVRDTRQIRLTPRGAPTGGNVNVELSSVTGNPLEQLAPDSLLRVQFGDGPLQQTLVLARTVVVKSPPHSAGTVDVKLVAERRDGTTEVLVNARAAFTYYDNNEPPDRSIFEPLLFPVAYEGPGAFGSRWTTENWVGTDIYGPAKYFHSAACTACPNPLQGRARLEPTSSASGLVLWPARGSMATIGASSRARDLSRQSENAGAQVPLARESSFAEEHRFPDLPIGEHSRAMLRVWVLDERSTIPFPSTPISVRIEIGAGYRDIALTASSPPSGLLFGVSDVTDLLQKAGGVSAEARVRSGRYRNWGIISVTNNETQQVTIIAPRPGEE